MAGWLSSSIVVGLCWGNPMSAANCRKYSTCCAQRPNARYSASQGLRAIAEASEAEWVTKGAVLVPIWIKWAEWLRPLTWQAWEESAAAVIVTPVGYAEGFVENVGPRSGQPLR